MSAAFHSSGNLSRRKPSQAIARTALIAATVLCVVQLTAGPAAAAVTAVTEDATGAAALATALTQTSELVTGASFVSVPSTGAPNGVATPPGFSFFPTDGTTFSILTTGNAQFANTANFNSPDGGDSNSVPDSGERSSELTGTYRGASDVTVLKVDLDVPEGTNCLRLDFAFYSEEFFEFVDTTFNDTFIAELDSHTWVADGGEITAPDNFAVDDLGQTVSINTVSATAGNAAGTTYDGASQLMTAATPVTAGAHSLYLSIFDASDRQFDSAVFLDRLRVLDAGSCGVGYDAVVKPTADAGGPYSVPEGSSITLDGSGSSDTDGVVQSYGWAPAANIDVANVANPTFSGVDDQSQTLTLTVTDDDGLTDTDTAQAVVTNVAPSITSVNVPALPVLVGAPASVTATYTDPGTLDTHTWAIDWGDGTPATTGTGSVTANHSYASPGSYSVAVTVTDDNLGTDTMGGASQIVVVSELPPTAEAGGPYQVDEGSSVTLDGSSSSDGDGTITGYAWTPDVKLVDAAVAQPTYTGVDDGSETLTLTVTDNHGLTGSDTATVTVNNVAPDITAVTPSATPIPLGSSATVSASFTDPGTADTHTWSIDWDDGSADSAGAGAITGSHTYGAAGIYAVTATVTDDDLGSDTMTAESYVVVYPPGGAVTGGGWMESPPGAHTPDDQSDADVVGRANFGFVSSYKKGATVPTGTTEFQFQAGALNFHSNQYDWLVVAGSKAMYKGTGSVNGQVGYDFLLSAVDGGKTGTDRLRMKIWENASGVVLYDNQAGATDDSAAVTAIAGGSIVIRK